MVGFVGFCVGVAVEGAAVGRTVEGALVGTSEGVGAAVVGGVGA